MLYFDFSLIVSLLSSEARPVELQRWFSDLDPNEAGILEIPCLVP